MDEKIPGEVLLEALCFFVFESGFDETCSFSLLLKSLNKDTVGDLPQGKVSSWTYRMGLLDDDLDRGDDDNEEDDGEDDDEEDDDDNDESSTKRSINDLVKVYF